MQLVDLAIGSIETITPMSLHCRDRQYRVRTVLKSSEIGEDQMSLENAWEEG
jgi:hypothetical protein